MHRHISIAPRTRSRVDKNVATKVVIGESSDDDIAGVLDEVPAKFEASGSGTKRFDSGATGIYGLGVSNSEEVVKFPGEVGGTEGKGSENCEDCGDEMGVRRKGKRNRVEANVGMKRKRKFGLDILVDHNATHELKSVAQRTRSRFGKTKKEKLGTFSQPICVDDDHHHDGADDNVDEEEQEPGDVEEQEQGDVEEQEQGDEEEQGQGEEEQGQEDEEEGESLSDSDFDEDDDDTEESGDSDEEEYRGGGNGKGEGYACAEKVARKYKRKKCDFDVAKILKDSLYQNGKFPLETIYDDDDDDGEPSPDTVLQSKLFSFSDEKSTQPEKPREEEDLDKIWVEMERNLYATPECTGSDPPLVSPLEGGSNKRSCRGSSQKGSSCARKIHEIHDRISFGEVSNFLLEDSIYDKGEVPRNASVEGRTSCVDLPLKFNFVPEEPKAEKSEHEKELDTLWEEMYCGLDDIQQEKSASASQLENVTDSDDDEYALGDPKIPPLYRCRQGKHDLRLDEETGLVCKYCLHVDLDIKHWTAPFLENPCGNYDRKDYYTGDHLDHSFFDELEDRTSGYDDYNHCNHKGTVWDIIPGVKKTMYPHQCEAFEFLWKNVAGGIILDKLKGQDGLPNGSGCIISHAPGTGKTRLAIVFLQTYMELNPTCKPMIIAPKGMLLTWEEEFKTWKVDIPFHNLNKSEYSGNEDEVIMNHIKKQVRNAPTQAAKRYCRMAKLYSWKSGKSILGVSYTLFENLTRPGCRDKKLRKFLLKQPGLLVLDEGHTPRNSQTGIWKSVTEIQTKQRIILSGTPFQNNFDELYNTLCLARPKFAERNPREENRGKWGYLTNLFGKATDDNKRLKILEKIRDMIRPFVHVHKGTILQDRLRGLRQMVVILKPTQLQKQLLEDIQKRAKKRHTNILKIEYEESLTTVHPALFDLCGEGKEEFRRFRLNPEESAKTRFVMELIRLSEIFNEKVLVFSQFIEPFNLLTSQLKHHFGWSEGREVLRIHGKLEARVRQQSIKDFNNPKSKVRVMLASIKACYEGISLVGASRVVLLDVMWNPSVERQAISRAYRLGQKKLVYTYHLITMGTRDEEKCSRQAEKEELSEFVFFNSDGAQNREVLSSGELEDKLLEQMVQQERLRHMFEKVAIKKQNLL